MNTNDKQIEEILQGFMTEVTMALSGGKDHTYAEILDYAKSKFRELFKSSQSSLLDEVEKRVIGEDDEMHKGTGRKNPFDSNRNTFRAYQREELQNLRKERGL